MQMAVSDYRLGKWTPKRVSKDYRERPALHLDIVPLEATASSSSIGPGIDGRVVVNRGLQGSSKPLGQLTVKPYMLGGAFELIGCTAVDVRLPGASTVALSPGSLRLGSRRQLPDLWKEKQLGGPRRLPSTKTSPSTPTRSVEALRFIPVQQTPGHLRMTPPWHLSYFDQSWPMP